MLFTSLTQYAVLVLLLLIGWLFGYASHSGGKKWRQRYEAEVAARAEERAALTERARTAEARTVAPAAVAALPAAATSDAAPTRRGWFAWRDEGQLTRIRGIDAGLAARLRDEGIAEPRDLASLSDTDEVALERRLGLPAGTIMRDEWREQARLLTDHRDADHAARFGVVS